jgi:hypothetical protein
VQIIAQLEFNVNSLPPGWVKETAFRKRSDGGIRKDHVSLIYMEHSSVGKEKNEKY